MLLKNKIIYSSVEQKEISSICPRQTHLYLKRSFSLTSAAFRLLLFLLLSRFSEDVDVSFNKRCRESVGLQLLARLQESRKTDQ